MKDTRPIDRELGTGILDVKGAEDRNIGPSLFVGSPVPARVLLPVLRRKYYSGIRHEQAAGCFAGPALKRPAKDPGMPSDRFGCGDHMRGAECIQSPADGRLRAPDTGKHVVAIGTGWWPLLGLPPAIHSGTQSSASRGVRPEAWVTVSVWFGGGTPGKLFRLGAQLASARGLVAAMVGTRRPCRSKQNHQVPLVTKPVPWHNTLDK